MRLNNWLMIQLFFPITPNVYFINTENDKQQKKVTVFRY